MRRIAVFVTAGLVLIAVALVTYVVSNNTDDADADGGPSPVDVGFAQDMVVHHQQAVVMAAYTREHARSDDVRGLAGVIDAAQQREIGQMVGWLQSWGRPVASDRMPMSWMASDHPHDGHGGDGSMPGMATTAEMDQLVNLSGERLDIQFLKLMTRHHEGGLPMAKDAATRARTPYVRNAARTMIQDQQREIDQMKTLLEAVTAARPPS